MLYVSTIDNIFATKFNLSLSQAYLLDWIIKLPTWAKKITVDNEVYYFASRKKVTEDLPLLTDKPDTVYRHYKSLVEMGFIKTTRVQNAEYVAFTDKTKGWLRKSEHSENFPTHNGNISDTNSENFPTNNLIITNNIINNKQTDEKFKNNFSGEVKEKSNTQTPGAEILNYPFNNSPEFVKAWTAWIFYKKKEHNFSYKEISTEQIAINNLVKKSNNVEAKAIQMIYDSIERKWQGIFDGQKNNLPNQQAIPFAIPSPITMSKEDIDKTYAFNPVNNGK